MCGFLQYLLMPQVFESAWFILHSAAWKWITPAENLINVAILVPKRTEPTGPPGVKTALILPVNEGAWEWMEPLLSIVMIWPTKSLGMKLANGKISVLINWTTWKEGDHHDIRGWRQKQQKRKRFRDTSLNARTDKIPRHRSIRSAETPEWTDYLGGSWRRKTQKQLAPRERILKPAACVTEVLPFGEKKVFKGVGQLRPHGVELPGRGMLARNRQPDGQHLEQRRHGELPGALRRTGVLQTQRHS